MKSRILKLHFKYILIKLPTNVQLPVYTSLSLYVILNQSKTSIDNLIHDNKTKNTQTPLQRVFTEYFYVRLWTQIY